MSARLRYLPIGVAASIAQALILIPGFHEDGSFDAGPWLIMLSISLVVSTLIFTLAVPRGGARTALALGVLACLGAVAFWAMFAFPVAAGAVVVGLRARRVGTRWSLANAAVVLAVLATIATIAITIGDAASS